MKKLAYFLCGVICTIGFGAWGVFTYDLGRESAMKEIEGDSDKEKFE